MVKIIPSALISGIKGKLQGTTFQDWKGTITGRKNPNPVKFQKEYRSLVKGIISTVAGCYYSLTCSQVDEWNAFANLHPTSMSGFNAFTKANVALIAAKNEALSINFTAPQLLVKPDTPVIVSGRYSIKKTSFILNWFTPTAVTTYVTGFYAPQSGRSNLKSAAWRAGLTEPSNTNRIVFDAAGYPATQVFRMRGRSIFTNGVFSSYSSIVSAAKSDPFSYPPWLYVMDTDNYRMTKFSTINNSFVSNIGSAGSGNDNFDQPVGICSDEDFVYIADTANVRIVKRNKTDGSFVCSYEHYGTGNHEYNTPYGICCDDYFLYVTDFDLDKVMKHEKSDLSWLGYWGTTGIGDQNLDTPLGCCISEDYVFIADSGNNRIQKLIRSILVWVEWFGTVGSGNNNFSLPCGVECDGTYIYVVDSGNNRLKRHLVSDNSYYDQVGTLGSGNENFNNPRFCAINSTYIYISDEGNSRVVIRYLDNLTFFTTFGSNGSGPGEFLLISGICTMTTNP